MRIAIQNASLNPLCSVDGLDKLEDEQWLYEGLGLSDDELDTYDQADRFSGILLSMLPSRTHSERWDSTGLALESESPRELKMF